MEVGHLKPLPVILGGDELVGDVQGGVEGVQVEDCKFFSPGGYKKSGGEASKNSSI